MNPSVIRQRLEPLPIRTAAFIEPMDALSVAKLPDGPEWVWEIKLDGYRALAVKTGSGVMLYSRRKKSLNRQFPYIVEALANLPSGTIIDGEVVGLHENGKPNFNLLQTSEAKHPASNTTFSIFCVSRITTLLGYRCASGGSCSIHWFRSLARESRSPNTSEREGVMFWKRFASKNSRESSGSGRTASTSPESEVVLG